MTPSGSSLALQDRHDVDARLTQRFYVKTGAKVLAVAVAVFVLTRIWGPNLINRHQDLALAGGVACYVAAVTAIGWVAVQIRMDHKSLTAGKIKRDLDPS